MQFEWSFNVGHLFTLAGVVITAMSIYYAMRFDVKVAALELSQLGGRLINVENRLEELTRLTMQMAEGTLRMEALDERFIEQSRRINNIDEHGTRQIQSILHRLAALEKKDP